MLNVPVFQIVLDRPGVLPVIGELVTSTMPQHVRMYGEWQIGYLTSPGNELGFYPVTTDS